MWVRWFIIMQQTGFSQTLNARKSHSDQMSSIGYQNSWMSFLPKNLQEKSQSIQTWKQFLYIQELLIQILGLKSVWSDFLTNYAAAFMSQMHKAQGLQFICRLRSLVSWETDSITTQILSLGKWIKGQEIQKWLKSYGKWAKKYMELSLILDMIYFILFYLIYLFTFSSKKLN